MNLHLKVEGTGFNAECKVTEKCREIGIHHSSDQSILNLGRFAIAKLLRFSYTERLSLLILANSGSRSIS